MYTKRSGVEKNDATRSDANGPDPIPTECGAAGDETETPTTRREQNRFSRRGERVEIRTESCDATIGGDSRT